MRWAGPPLAIRLALAQVDAMIGSRGFEKLGHVEIGGFMYLSTYKKSVMSARGRLV
jgi:hypothetical protein